MTFKLPSRADHVGSFLRPQSVIEARDAFAAGSIDAAALREVEDKAIAELAAWQEGLGLKAITDGEFRRKFFHTDFLLQLSGVEETGGIKKAFKNNTRVVIQTTCNRGINSNTPVRHAHIVHLLYKTTKRLNTSFPQRRTIYKGV